MAKIGFLFPGQGAQFVGMGADVAATVPAAAALFELANDVLGYDLQEVCFAGPEENLNATEHSQPALFVSSMASLEKLKQDNADAVDSCQLTAGLSLGEYSALCFAGVLSFEDGLRVVRARGQAMQSAADSNPGGMVAVLGLELGQIEDLCDQARLDGGVLRVANHLCPGNIVCSGDIASCETLTSLAQDAGAMKVISLAVAGAFHTDMMQAARQPLAEALSQVPMASPRIPIVSNVDAQQHTDPERIRELLINQIVSPVLWEASVRAMLSEGVEAFYEIGAGKVIRGLMRRIDRKIAVTNV